MRFIALESALSGDIVRDSNSPARSGVMVITNDGSEEEIDSLAVSLQEVSQDSVFVLRPQVLNSSKAITIDAASGRRLDTWVGRIGAGRNMVEVSLLDCTYASHYPMRLSSKFINNTGAVIQVGSPHSAVDLYPYVEAVVHEGQAVEVEKLSELVSYLGSCADPMQILRGCSSCTERACYQHARGSKGLVYEWLEKQKGYIKPSGFDSVFSPRRVSRLSLRNHLDWDGTSRVANDRLLAAEKAKKTRHKKKTDCSRCVENLRKGYYADKKCSRMKDCEGPVTAGMTREAMLDFSKSAGLATHYGSYLAQANIHLAGCGIVARVDGRKKQTWHVAYAFDPRSKSKNYHSFRVSKVEPYYTDLDVSKVPSRIRVLLYKDQNTYTGREPTVVRLKDLLLGLVSYTGLNPLDSVPTKAKWKKVPRDVILMHNTVNAMPSARYISCEHSKDREYDIWGYGIGVALPTTVGKIAKLLDEPGSPYAVKMFSYRPFPQTSFKSYYSWLDRSSLCLRKVEDLYKSTYTGRGNVSSAILGSA